jgi:hypothetical protein
LRNKSSRSSTPLFDVGTGNGPLIIHRNNNWFPPASKSSRPFPNEFRKRVPVRLHPLSCDFSATSLISVIAKLRAKSRRDPLPRRNSECGFGVRGHVRASAFIRFRRDKLVRRDMSRRGKRQHVAAIQKRCHAIALHIKNRPARSGGRS